MSHFTKRRALGVPLVFLLAACARHTPAPPGGSGAAHADSLPPSPPLTTPAPPVSTLVDAFPGVRVDRAARVVEFDATVPINCHDPRTPNVYLELIACTPDTREHEVLAVTSAKPSHVHAALLLLGLEPGAPASWSANPDKSLNAHPPTGPRVRVELITTGPDGVEQVHTPSEWIVNATNGEAWPKGEWLFSGSMFVKRQGEERYDADFSGTLIGLTTFGTEVLAWPKVISPEAAVDEPVWIANTKTVPEAGTPVIIRLRPVD